MNPPVIAIGLDSADPELLEKWMSQGHLKNLARLRQQGAYGRLTNMEYCKGETPWTTFLTGCLPHKSGYWSMFRFHKHNYKVEDRGAYDFAEYPPFYSLGDKYRVAAFDLPQALLSKNVNGMQVLAWGAHAPYGPSVSEPKEVLPNLIEQYGTHPADPQHHKDRADWYNPASVARLKQNLEAGLARRTAITRDLLKREPWDLFVTVIAETHTIEHYFWHLSQPDHPLYQPHACDSDPMLELFEKVDESLGEMLADIPDNAQVVVFSPHGMGPNSTDVLSMVMLPEFLYRFNFPGKALLKSEPIGNPPGRVMPENAEESWYRQIPKLKQEPKSIQIRQEIFKVVRQAFPSSWHYRLSKVLGVAPPPLSFQPPTWSHRYWHKMKAFALPSFSDGYIRINLKGRERNGVVSPSEYNALCDRITEQLHLLTDARTGQPIVKKVIRIRENPTDSNPKLPDADLIVSWHDHPVDVVDSPTYGRLGPVFLNRSGSHRGRGFLIAKGPGIAPGSTLAEGHGVDLAPTILELMGAPIPEHFDGKPLVETKVLV